VASGPFQMAAVALFYGGRSIFAIDCFAHTHGGDIS